MNITKCCNKLSNKSRFVLSCLTETGVHLNSTKYHSFQLRAACFVLLHAKLWTAFMYFFCVLFIYVGDAYFISYITLNS